MWWIWTWDLGMKDIGGHTFMACSQPEQPALCCLNAEGYQSEPLASACRSKQVVRPHRARHVCIHGPASMQSSHRGCAPHLGLQLCICWPGSTCAYLHNLDSVKHLELLHSGGRAGSYQEQSTACCSLAGVMQGPTGTLSARVCPAVQLAGFFTSVGPADTAFPISSWSVMTFWSATAARSSAAPQQPAWVQPWIMQLFAFCTLQTTGSSNDGLC